MNTKNKTQQDKFLSLSADEFVWEEVGDSPVDCLVVPPIVNLFTNRFDAHGHTLRDYVHVKFFSS